VSCLTHVVETGRLTSSLNLPIKVNGREKMAIGLYVLPDRSVMAAQYKTNEYKPALEKLTVTNSFTAQKVADPSAG
jgi:hypothetical protein